MQKKRLFLILFGVLFVVNAVAASFISNLSAGILFTYLAGAVFVIIGSFYDVIVQKIPSAVRYAFWALCSLAVCFMLFIIIYGNIDHVTYDEDAVIVLGAGLQGEEPAVHLKSRLDAAVMYYQRNPRAVIVVSGGQGPGEDITESLAMKRYLIAQGIPEDQIIEEPAATSTEENFRYSKSILDGYFDESYSVVFITNDYHILRSSLHADAAGFDDISHCHSRTPLSLLIPNGIRESLGVILQFVLLR